MDNPDSTPSGLICCFHFIPGFRPGLLRFSSPNYRSVLLSFNPFRADPKIFRFQLTHLDIEIKPLSIDNRYHFFTDLLKDSIFRFNLAIFFPDICHRIDNNHVSNQSFRAMINFILSLSKFKVINF